MFNDLGQNCPGGQVLGEFSCGLVQTNSLCNPTATRDIAASLLKVRRAFNFWWPVRWCSTSCIFPSEFMVALGGRPATPACSVSAYIHVPRWSLATALLQASQQLNYRQHNCRLNCRLSCRHQAVVELYLRADLTADLHIQANNAPISFRLLHTAHKHLDHRIHILYGLWVDVC